MSERFSFVIFVTFSMATTRSPTSLPAWAAGPPSSFGSVERYARGERGVRRERAGRSVPSGVLLAHAHPEVSGERREKNHRARAGAVPPARCHASPSPEPAPCSVPTDVDRKFMNMAIDISLTPGDASSTYPNPRVGCVIVSEAGQVVGLGYHPKAGMPHAEPYALRGAGQMARGATAYVTLEPCDHYGRTPPCSQALIDAGIRRVVVGIGDPNPLVDGGGIARLRKAGVEVVVGCEEDRCFEVNQAFFERISGDS